MSAYVNAPAGSTGWWDAVALEPEPTLPEPTLPAPPTPPAPPQGKRRSKKAEPEVAAAEPTVNIDLRGFRGVKISVIEQMAREVVPAHVKIARRWLYQASGMAILTAPASYEAALLKRFAKHLYTSPEAVQEAAQAKQALLKRCAGQA